MKLRAAIFVTLCLALCGCVLKSGQPAFTEQQTELIFGNGTINLEIFGLQDGQWQKANTEDQAPLLTTEGRHYRFEEPSNNGGKSKTTIISFAPVATGVYLVQMQDELGGTEYAMAQWDGKELLARGLFCSDIKGLAAADDMMVNDGSECILKDGIHQPEEFAALYGHLRKPDVKVIRKTGP